MYRPQTSSIPSGSQPVSRSPVLKRDTVGTFEARLRWSARWRWLAPLLLVVVVALAGGAWTLLSRRGDVGAERIRAEALALVALDDGANVEEAISRLTAIVKRRPKLRAAAADRALALVIRAAQLGEEAEALSARAAVARRRSGACAPRAAAGVAGRRARRLHRGRHPRARGPRSRGADARGVLGRTGAARDPPVGGRGHARGGARPRGAAGALGRARPAPPHAAGGPREGAARSLDRARGRLGRGEGPRPSRARASAREARRPRRSAPRPRPRAVRARARPARPRTQGGGARDGRRGPRGEPEARRGAAAPRGADRAAAPAARAAGAGAGGETDAAPEEVRSTRRARAFPGHGRRCARSTTGGTAPGASPPPAAARPEGPAASPSPAAPTAAPSSPSPAPAAPAPGPRRRAAPSGDPEQVIQGG